MGIAAVHHVGIGGQCAWCWILILGFLGAQNAAALGLNYYDLSTGAFVSVADPVLAGGDFDGQALSAVDPVEVMGVSGNTTWLLGPSGWNLYDLTTGALGEQANPTLVGGDFDGEILVDVPADNVPGTRAANAALRDLYLIGPSGYSQYDLDTGSLVFSEDAIFSGGDFDGATYSSLSPRDVIGLGRLIDDAAILLIGPSGASRYSFDSLFAVYNPTFVGGDFAGQTLSDLSASDFAGASSTTVVLHARIPEPSGLLLLGTSMLPLGVYLRRRMRS